MALDSRALRLRSLTNLDIKGMCKESELHLCAEEGEEYMENCTLGTTVDQLGAPYTNRLLSGIDASANFSPNEKPRWSMLHQVFDRVRAKVPFKPMFLVLLILVLCSSAVVGIQAAQRARRYLPK